MGIRLRSLMLCLALGIFGQLALAQSAATPARVVIVTSDNTAAYTQAADALVNALLSRQVVARAAITRVGVADLALQFKSGAVPSPVIFVALGSDATQLLVGAGLSAPVLSALIPRRSFERILRRYKQTVSPRLTAVYLDQPLVRQLALIRLALPSAQRVGVLLSTEAADNAAAMRALAQVNNLALRTAIVPKPEDLSNGLTRLLDESDVLLAQADPLIFNSGTIQNILLTSFRAGVPMVAFSPAYVRAGAALALYTTPAQAGTQAAELVVGVMSGKLLPDNAIEPNDFEVGVNINVANAMGLGLNGPTLRQALRRLERLP